MSILSHKCGSKLLLLIFLCAWGGFSTSAEAVLDRARTAGMVPHKALYDVRLSAKKSGSNILNISGTMFYEWQPSCDAWISTHRFDMLYEYPEVPAVRITSDFSTYESFDGKAFNFTLQRKRDGDLYEEIRGSAQSEGQSFPDEVVYSIPRDVSFHLPEGTLFPMAHTLSVLEKIKQGKKFYNATIFDGSDAEGPVDINSFIGKAATYVPPPEYARYIDNNLTDVKSWNVRLAFFPLNNFQETSDYEMSLIVHENGVISNMEVNYKDFSVTQTLRAIEPLEGTCKSE